MITDTISQEQAAIYSDSLSRFENSGLIENIKVLIPEGKTPIEYESFGEAITCVIKILEESSYNEQVEEFRKQLSTKLVMMASVAFSRAKAP